MIQEQLKVKAKTKEELAKLVPKGWKIRQIIPIGTMLEAVIKVTPAQALIDCVHKLDKNPLKNVDVTFLRQQWDEDHNFVTVKVTRKAKYVFTYAGYKWAFLQDTSFSKDLCIFELSSGGLAVKDTEVVKIFIRFKESVDKYIWEMPRVLADFLNKAFPLPEFPIAVLF